MENRIERMKQLTEMKYAAMERAESTPFAKSHLKIKSSKGKVVQSNLQPAKKKRKKK
jgi:hypothetical protein